MHGMTELRVSDVFDVTLGDGKYTKAWCQAHPGNYPVYSGTTVGPYMSIDSYDHDGHCLTWAKDGLAGYVMEHDGERFSITNHRGMLRLRRQYEGLIFLPYAKYVLEPLFRTRRVGRLADGEHNEYTALNKTAVSNVMMPVPVLDDGHTPDVERQRAYAAKMASVERLRADLRERYDKLVTAAADIRPLVAEMPHKDVPVGELFEVRRGDGAYTRAYIQGHRGSHPLYTAKNDGPAGFIDTFDHEGPCLTVSLNGLAGRITIIAGKFSCTADRAALLPRRDDIDQTYFRAVAEPAFLQRRHGRIGEGESNEYTKLGVTEIKRISIPIPIDGNGDPDRAAQSRLVDQYSRLEMTKGRVLEGIDALCAIDIDFEI